MYVYYVFLKIQMGLVGQVRYLSPVVVGCDGLCVFQVFCWGGGGFRGFLKLQAVARKDAYGAVRVVVKVTTQCRAPRPFDDALRVLGRFLEELGQFRV